MRALFLGLAVAVGLAASAEARVHHPYRAHRITVQAVPVGPLDAFTSPSAAYGFRKLKSTYAGNAVRLRRTSDNAEADIGFVGYVPGLGSPIDFVAANAHCTSPCSIVTMYDQSGNARNVTNATPVNQPAYLASCQNGLPCAVSTPTAQVLVGPSVTPAGSVSVSAVGKSAAAENCVFLQVGSNSIGSNLSGSWWLLFSSGPVIVGNAAHGQWHSGQGTFNSSGFTSPLQVDGTLVTNDVGPILTAGTIRVAAGGAGGAIACSTAEAVWWNNYALTPAERTALTANQRSFWGF